jgi:TetR/AcrR family transcriptional repressor of bet genes
MPKIGQEPLRRAALMEAAVAEIGEAGTLDVTVGQIARRAGMSSALAHH